MNLIFPLLHRPTFEQSLADNLHLREQRFGGVVLLVAAVGARFSNDPRVSTPGTHFINSAGCVWFNQVQIALRSFCNLPGLYDLQIYCVRPPPCEICFGSSVSLPIVIRDILARFSCATLWLDCHRNRCQIGTVSRCS